ncbi:MAG TPA: aldehyde dehydrogenase family protein, partial [Dokdonella sp.]
MSGSLRITAIVLCTVALCACGRTMLYANLDEQQANQVQGALLAAGIDADKQPADNKKGWSVEVGKDDFPLAMQLLQAKGLPSAPFESMGMVFKKEGFVSSPLEERARYLYAIARHIQKHSRHFAVLESLDNGKPIRESRDLDIPLVVRHFYHHTGWA